MSVQRIVWSSIVGERLRQREAQQRGANASAAAGRA